MSSGKVHNKFNLIVGAIITGIMVGLGIDSKILISFILGWLLSTFILSPDLDTGPRNRRSWSSFILYPYSILFKHRGISHSLFFGTITRLLYVVSLFIMTVFILKFFNIITVPAEGIYKLLFSYDYHQLQYYLLTWLIVGMFSADTCHLFLDKFSTLRKRIF